ncbi:hypothetical protein DPMN_124141 [Dreissena polymorpha]|uniref:Uncharacterized protein n=1 Tax=Dreissena polymorpha TaxID=45954 RepID=A0A9D4JVW3_DREPO|nr:hypothetical protein DPMN_124141 [Dreissena polymorpha]
MADGDQKDTEETKKNVVKLKYMTFIDCSETNNASTAENLSLQEAFLRYKEAKQTRSNAENQLVLVLPYPKIQSVQIEDIKIPGPSQPSAAALHPGECWWSYGIPGLCRDVAGFHTLSTWALPAITMALPGLHRDKPLCGVVDRFQTGRH